MEGNFVVFAVLATIGMAYSKSFRGYHERVLDTVSRYIQNNQFNEFVLHKAIPVDEMYGFSPLKNNLVKSKNQKYAKLELASMGKHEEKPGYYYQYVYTGESCGKETDFYYTQGVVTNVCLNSRQNTTSDGKTSSYLYTCHDGKYHSNNS